MYLNKIFVSSTERIITRSPSTNNTFDIELQHPQPRQRQRFNQNLENNDNNDQYYAYAYSIPPKQEEFYSSEPNQRLSINNLVKIPTNLSTISPPNPLIMSSSPAVVEEK
jgi:hypothetical protein